MIQIVKKIIALFYYNLVGKYKDKTGNRVILYHSIGTQLDFDTYGISISKEKFEEHIEFLRHEYEIIPIDKMYEHNLNRKTIAITFDDGYKDNLYALELCEKYNIPFTLYITTGFIGKKDYLTTEDIKRFSESSFCILGTHSVSHPHLDKLDYDTQYKELSESKRTLENIIGKEVVHMSYPHGSYNMDTIEIIDKLGYNVVSSSNIGLNTVNNLNLKELKRIEIIKSDNIRQLEKKSKVIMTFCHN